MNFEVIAIKNFAVEIYKMIFSRGILILQNGNFQTISSPRSPAQEFIFR
jgi:hypothetical protein